MNDAIFQIRAARLAPEKQVTNASLPAARSFDGVSTLETNVSYSDLLKDPRWQRKRLEILQRDSWKCRDCGSADQTLHVHHGLYRKGAKPWEYEENELFTLCDGCHGKRHNCKARLDELLKDMHWGDAALALGFVECITWMIHSKPRRFPFRECAQEFGEGWLSGFAAAIASSWGHDLEALEALVEEDGHIDRQIVMGLKRSFSQEPRGNG